MGKTRQMMVAATALMLATGAAQAATPSFDCARAVSPIEQLICQNEALATLDGTLGQAYRGARAKLNATDRQALTMGQRDWIAARGRSCAIPTSGEPPAAADAIACLTPLYDARIAELKSVPASTAAEPVEMAAAAETPAAPRIQRPARAAAEAAIQTPAETVADAVTASETAIAAGPREGMISSDPGPVLRSFEETPAQVVVQTSAGAAKGDKPITPRIASTSTERPASPLAKPVVVADSLAAPGSSMPSAASITGQPLTLAELSEGTAGADPVQTAALAAESLGQKADAPEAAPVTQVAASNLPMGLSGGEIAAGSLAVPAALPGVETMPAMAAEPVDQLAGFRALNLAQAVNDQCNILPYEQATAMAQFFNQQHKDLSEAGQLDEATWDSILTQTVDRLSAIDCGSAQARTLVQGTFARITPPAMN